MEILTFPVGVVVGAITVAVSLGDAPHAELRLDGASACALAPGATSCTVDLGPAPRVHLLELVNGERPSERVRRWVNRPGSGEAEVRVRERCPERGDTCTIAIATVHPDKLAPNGMEVLLDGKALARSPVASVEAPRPKEGSVRVLVVDATFADGRRAGSVRTMGRHGLSDETGASLQAVPVEPAEPGADPDALSPPASLGPAAVQALERADSEAVFVVDPAAYRHTRPLHAQLFAQSRAIRGVPRVLTPVAPATAAILEQAAEPGTMTFVDPRAETRFARITAERDWRDRVAKLLLGPTVALRGAPRIADAVAAAGALAASSQRRRALVLVLAGGADASGFSAREVAGYLAEIMVPLHVWRVVPGVDADWGAGQVVEGPADLRGALAAVNGALRHQRLAWVNGDLAPREIATAPGEAFRIAGR